MIDFNNVTKIPSIPSLDGIQDPAAKAAIFSLKKTIETLLGLIVQSNKLDTIVTYRDLYEAGLISEQWIKDNLE